ncbi:hypothetical protein MAMC_01009 [Methylacidimicrobium cyclopophantes]|uniref:Uncharacterized protein n=1 Tax=Methylacidimicrobium cyclopophantes TaxID=1041766 RepID=A0A5E6MA21_9BACT|nr:hypothetical protein [Methylacidimicrobium cyclopophantes]VVM06245.1 hypothetical protein MAMC_01009 [Methylacidimicrobium cyclopophantes]
MIVAQLKAANGVTSYEFRNWDSDPVSRGIGGAPTYVLAANGDVRVPWRFQWFGNDPPPWVRLGLTFREAVEMHKQVYKKFIQLSNFELARKDSLSTYRVAKPQSIPIDFYYPEMLEAQKELGLLPKDFVPPPLFPLRQHYLRMMLVQEKPKSQFTKEQNQAITKKLSELVRANALGDKMAVEKANEELDEIIHPKGSKQMAPSTGTKP